MILLVTLALVCSGCTPVKLIVHCTISNPQNCN